MVWLNDEMRRLELNISYTATGRNPELRQLKLGVMRIVR